MPRDMEEPKFLADPNHRKRTLKRELCGLVNRKVANRHTFAKCDVLRISTNFACMARTLTEDMTDDDIVDRAKAVPEHHFDNHECCGERCRRKPQHVGPIAEAEHKARRRKCHRHKERDAKLHSMSQQKIARFVTVDALREVCHNMDANVNESLNDTIAWIAPKNKVHSGTASLSNRICIALCITSVGTMEFFKRLFNWFGVTVTEDICHFLEAQHLRRAKRIAKTKTADGKKKRARKFCDKLTEHTVVAKKERKKRQSTHRSGIGMDGGHSSSDDRSDAPTTNKNKAQQKSKATAADKGVDTPKFCNKCQEHGHCRPSSRLCEHCKPRKRSDQFKSSTPEQTADERKVQTERDADESDVLDEMPLVDDGDSSDFFSAEEHSSGCGDESDDVQASGVT